MDAQLTRVAVRKHLVDMVKAKVAAVGLDGVEVLYQLPSPVAARRVICGGPVTGNVSVRGMKAGRKTRQDAFTVVLFCVAGPNSVPIIDDDTDPGGFFALDQAVLDQVNVIGDALADDPHLGLGQSGSQVTAVLGEVAGPDGFATKNGAASGATVSIDCVSLHD